MADVAVLDPSERQLLADLESAEFLNGVAAGAWRKVRYDFPLLHIAISATGPDGSPLEFDFRFEVSSYPTQAPEVRIWDHDADTPLAPNLRPKGGHRVEQSFKHWGDDTDYRPWDRRTGPHNNNARTYPHLAWRPDRDLVFILEDLHALLNSNARAHRLRSKAKAGL